MSAPPQAPGEPITDKKQLVDYLAAGSKPREDWRIGTEHEKFGYRRDDHRPLPYEGERGIAAILKGMERFGWEPVFEGENVIALTKEDGCNVTLEPGGQFELSGAPLETIHQTCDEVHTHLHQVKQVCAPLDTGMIGIGFRPKWCRADIPWMPKGRYEIMRAYMPTKGSLGLDMMLRTCTIQVNLDYSGEADMVKKFRVGLALQPVVTALFANSPFTEGKPNGFLSYRSHIWTDTDPDRCGILPFVFEDGMGFERYVDHVLDVPMYFVYRDGTYIDASGQSFRDFLQGKLPALPGEVPTTGDWADHLSTLFPEVPPGTWSRTGARRSTRRCAPTCPGAVSARPSAAGPCGRSPARPWRSPRPDCRREGNSTAWAATRPTSSTPCTRSPPAVLARPRACWMPTRAPGAAISTSSSKISPIERT